MLVKHWVDTMSALLRRVEQKQKGRGPFGAASFKYLGLGVESGPRRRVCLALRLHLRGGKSGFAKHLASRQEQLQALGPPAAFLVGVFHGQRARMADFNARAVR